jgi:hypothetical protein
MLFSKDLAGALASKEPELSWIEDFLKRNSITKNEPGFTIRQHPDFKGYIGSPKPAYSLAFAPAAVAPAGANEATPVNLEVPLGPVKVVRLLTGDIYWALPFARKYYEELKLRWPNQAVQQRKNFYLLVSGSLGQAYIVHDPWEDKDYYTLDRDDALHWMAVISTAQSVDKLYKLLKQKIQD